MSASVVKTGSALGTAIGALAAVVVVVGPPPAAAEPPTHHLQVTCDDGSAFTVDLVSPDSGNGLPSVYRFDDGTGAAADAGGFAWFRRVVLAPDGTQLAATGNIDGVARRHELVDCRHPGFRNPQNTFVLTGFFIP